MIVRGGIQAKAREVERMSNSVVEEVENCVLFVAAREDLERAEHFFEMLSSGLVVRKQSNHELARGEGEVGTGDIWQQVQVSVLGLVLTRRSKET